MTKKRPLIITILCIVLLLGSIVAIPFEVSLLLRGDTRGNPLSRLLIEIVGTIPFIGMWKMKRWGVILYTVVYATGLVWLLVTGQWSPATLLPLIIIAIGFSYYRQMD